MRRPLLHVLRERGVRNPRLLGLRSRLWLLPAPAERDETCEGTGDGEGVGVKHLPWFCICVARMTLSTLSSERSRSSWAADVPLF